MTYDPTTWNHEDVITSQKLNKIEKGLTDVAESAIFGFGGAQQSSDGLTPFSYINAGDPMPSNPKKGDTVFINDGNDFTIYSYDGEQWSIRVNPKLAERIQTTLDKAKADTADLITKKNDEINETIHHVAKEKIDLALKDADFNEKAQAMAYKALADAKANTAQVAQETLNSADKHLTDAKKDLTNSITREASQAVAAANSQAQNYVNQAKSDINDTINALSVGGRNLYLNSRGLADWYGPENNVTATVEPFDSTTNMWHIVAAQGSGNPVGIWLFKYGNGKLPDNTDWSYSADIKGTGKVVQFGIERGDKTPVKGNIGSKWSRISQTGHVNDGIKSIVMYFDTTDRPLDAYIKLPKLETGNIATDWSPAPEDVVLDYTTKDNKIKETITQYKETNDGKVRKAQTDATTALGLVETKVSQTDYDKKTGDLSTKYTQVKQTADSQAADIVDIKKTATSQASKINSISSDVDGTKQSISDIEKTQHGQSDKINQIINDVNGTKQSITDIQNKDGKQDTRMGTIETSVSGVKSDFSSYKDTNDGVVKTAQTTAQTAVDGLKTKVSQTDYNKKTGQLQTDLTTTTQTANQATTDIASIKKKDGEQDEKMNTIVSDANGTKQTVSDLKTAQDKQSGYISTLQQTAKGFESTVTKVDNLSIGGRNYFIMNNAVSGYLDAERGVHHDSRTDADIASDFIAVSPDETWQLTNWRAPNTAGNIIYAYYDSNKSFIDGSQLYRWLPATNSPITIPITIPHGVAYMRVSSQHMNSNQGAMIKVEKGTKPTDWTPAPEDTTTALAQVKITADGVSSIVSDPTKGLSIRVQTAEGTLHTVKSTADGAMSTASQTANDIKQEISDRKTGDSNTLQSSKDFTTSQITNSETGTKSLITQTADGIIAKVDTKTDSDTVLSLFKDNWSIGITDNIGKITSGIVGDTSQMSLISKKVVIDSPSTQIKGTAWINSAMIQKGSIVSANIAEATITSANIATLDVAKLTGNTTSFIKSNWASAYGNVSITPTNITLQSYTGDTLMSEFSVGDLGMTVKMPGISSFLESTIINANGMSFKHGGGSYATVGVMDAGFTLEHNNLGGAPMSIRIGDGIYNKANDMVFAISAAQDSGTSPQLIWAGNGVGKVSSRYRTWDNPAGFIIADNIKFSTWDNTASRVEFDDTVNFYNYAPVQVYGQRFSNGTTRELHLGGKDVYTGAEWFGFLDGQEQAGFGTDNSHDVIFFMGGKQYSLYMMLEKLGMR